MQTFYELFAGIGLVRDALEPLGWECIYANDINATKEAIYRRRYPEDAHFERQDIWEVDPASLPRPVDLIAASFPCIDLSLAGNRRGLAGAHSSAFWALIRLLDGLQRLQAMPQALMIENVAGFLSSHGGRDFRKAVEAINEHGYIVDVIQVSAEHFLPQSRPRLFMIALSDHLADTLMVMPSDGMLRWRTAVTSNGVLRPEKIRQFMLSEPLRWGVIDYPPLPRRTMMLEEVIDWECSDWWSHDRVERFLTEMEPLHQARVQMMMQRGERRVATAYRRVRNGRCVYELRTDGIAGCLRTSVGGSSKQIVIVIDGMDVKVRWMAPIEYGRLQGVPHSEALADFKGNDLRTAFGDAICVPAYRWIADHALGSLVGRITEQTRQPRQLALF